MPFYTEKYQTVRDTMDNLDTRVLLNSSALSFLKDRIEKLSRENATIRNRDKPSTQLRNQLALVLTEIEELVLGSKRSPPDFAFLGESESLELTIDSLQAIARVLRDSHVRAETILEGLDAPKSGKLVKRERREQMRKESIASLAASVAVTPPRALSPPSRVLFPENRSEGAASSRSK